MGGQTHAPGAHARSARRGTLPGRCQVSRTRVPCRVSSRTSSSSRPSARAGNASPSGSITPCGVTAIITPDGRMPRASPARPGVLSSTIELIPWTAAYRDRARGGRPLARANLRAFREGGQWWTGLAGIPALKPPISPVMPAGEVRMEISARNQLKGRSRTSRPGPHERGGGRHRRSGSGVDDLEGVGRAARAQAGRLVVAIIKATEVMIGK